MQLLIDVNFYYYSEMISNSDKLTKTIIPNIHKQEVNKFEATDDNMIRSVALYYSGGVMGKKGYRRCYRNSAYKLG